MPERRESSPRPDRPRRESTQARPSPAGSPVLTRRRILRLACSVGLAALGAPFSGLASNRLLSPESPRISSRAVDLVLETTVVDLLSLLTLDWNKLFRWQREPGAFSRKDFRTLQETGVGIFHPAVEPASGNPRQAALRWIDGWNLLIRSHPCHLARIDSTTDLLNVPKLGKLGLLLGFQNSSHFESIADVARFHRRGQRVSQLTYNGDNALGSGCLVPDDGGLTDFGARVIEEMNRVGMAIDISHCGDRTSREAIAISRSPVLITHSNCRALVPWQPRCVPDDVIRLTASSGGVMGITMVRSFVGGGNPSLEDVLDHFDHVARLVGIEHVALGTDVAADAVDRKTGLPLSPYRIRGVDLHHRVFQVADGLLRRGYSERQVELVLGKNALRVLAEIWANEEFEPLSARERRRDPFCPPTARPESRSRS